MDRILIILKKNKWPKSSTAPLLGIFSMIFKHIYWYIQQILGERLQDNWPFGCFLLIVTDQNRPMQEKKAWYVKPVTHLSHQTHKLSVQNACKLTCGTRGKTMSVSKGLLSSSSAP